MSDMWIILRNSKGKEKKSHFPTKAKKKKKTQKPKKTLLLKLSSSIVEARAQETKG